MPRAVSCVKEKRGSSPEPDPARLKRHQDVEATLASWLPCVGLPPSPLFANHHHIVALIPKTFVSLGYTGPA
jgi:hypothetical protein